MKQGTIFEHRHWLDTSHRPLLCVVTAVRAGTVYWAIWPSNGRGRYYFDEAESVRHVGSIIEGDHLGRPCLEEK